MKKRAEHDEPPMADVTPLTLLVIDDEKSVRQLVRRMLEPHICRVIEAAGGEEGLAIADSPAVPIDAVLTDLRMPGLSGLEVVDALTRRAPRLPILIMTGNADAGSAVTAVKVLRKPFEPRDVIGAVIEALVQGRAARGTSVVKAKRPDPSAGKTLS